MKRLGGLWQHNKDGKKYLEGTLELKVLIFKNENKRTGKSPDFEVYVEDAPKLTVKPVASKGVWAGEYTKANELKVEEDDIFG